MTSFKMSIGISPSLEAFLLLTKGALSGLREYLTNENPLKIIKNAFDFTLKALSVLKLFKFLSWLFGRLEKRLD